MTTNEQVMDFYCRVSTMLGMGDLWMKFDKGHVLLSWNPTKDADCIAYSISVERMTFVRPIIMVADRVAHEMREQFRGEHKRS